jgi:predicted O-methyltransferase YrrM
MSNFSQNWFEGLAQNNFETLKEIIDTSKPINFLEIGCFEGNCHKWMYENILVNPISRSTVIDPFEKSLTHPDSYSSFKNNLSDNLDKITIFKGYSDDILPLLEKESFDIIYIDGDHTAEAAFKDGINCFPLLKKGGIMIFDDYLWCGLIGGEGSYNNIGNWNNPCTGVNCFLFMFKEQVELLDNFTPPFKVISTRNLYHNIDYQTNYSNKFNYQIFLKKI